jgi:FkbH-like protein
VPKRLPEYFRVIESVRHLFGAPDTMQAGPSKTEQYRTRQAGSMEAAKFASKEDYLRSLGLKVKVTRDDESSIARIAELTLKSNQFNLTTRRYAKGDIEKMMRAEDHSVYAFSVEDKFGASGLTGVLIGKREEDTLVIDTFLMSCRVIGRGLEFAIWNLIFEDARQAGCRQLQASYIPTAKNAQVKDFYERLGLDLAAEDADGAKHYHKDLAALRDVENDYIQVTYAR